ncbi:hypothetical protein B0T25DRAFT_522052 [Lasiosphaeria hispida]|uniref:Carboxylesterase family protein n=1 Tax=Lasiosphaeria hispida TaxID=260671 RepID=A0AAJ0H906_9PEZI|nr:hypothetical protein B0T25DRAFT_522052 [Lasiosphaeria hispida]
MATGTRPRPAVEFTHDFGFDTHEDNSRPALPSVLEELPLGNIQNISKPTIEALTIELGNLHIHSPTKENLYEQQRHQYQLQTTTKIRGRKPRPQLEASTFQAPLPTQYEEEDSFCDSARRSSGVSIASHKSEETQTHNPLAISIPDLPSNPEQLSKHQAGQFEWVLSIPAARRDSAEGDRRLDSFAGDDDGRSPREEVRRLLFGCNLVQTKTQSEGSLGDGDDTPANVFTLLATRIESEEEKLGCVHEAAAADEQETMADTTIIRLTEAQVDEAEARMSEVTLNSKNNDIMEQLIALPPARPTSRIEDSVEALDKLEEELEALNEVTRLDGVLSPETSKASAPARSIDSVAPKTAPLKRTSSIAGRSGASTVRVRGGVERSSSIRKSTSMTFTKDEEKPAAAKSTASRRSIVTRPASLLPPKAPARSSKPPTVPTFALPGEAVARRLKEQREARLSRQISPEQAAAVAEAYSPSKPHAKSSKPPTRPTFELPGEAISRRKREEREAKLRAQEEEERKRREFKARPVRHSINPGSYPRGTVASRARQGHSGTAGGQSEAGESSAAGPASGAAAVAAATPGTAKKRHSMAVPSTTPRASLSIRGRSELAVDSAAATSRATSSTGSAHGAAAGSVISVSKRSNLSAEEAQQQKVRGREIFQRDNSYVTERERERREREAATARARQEAAERSRQLSREWAEKQKGKSLRGGSGSGSGSGKAVA